MTAPATLRLYSSTQRRSLRTAVAARALWRRIDPAGDWSAQWAKLSPRVLALLLVAQTAAAREGAASVAASLAEDGFPEDAVGSIVPRAFAGWVESADMGGVVPLEKALSASIISARLASGTPEQMLAAGERSLAALARTAVADAARHATQAQAVATPRATATWYEPPPYCQRCGVMIGRRVSPTAQFIRHPQCDGMVRVLSERDRRTLATASVDEITDLSKAQRQAIADGADLGRVVNAHRQGALRDKGMLTTAGAGRGRMVMTPKAIYREAGDDRAAAIALLRKHGYIR